MLTILIMNIMSISIMSISIMNIMSISIIVNWNRKTILQNLCTIAYDFITKLKATFSHEHIYERHSHELKMQCQKVTEFEWSCTTFNDSCCLKRLQSKAIALIAKWLAQSHLITAKLQLFICPRSLHFPLVHATNGCSSRTSSQRRANPLSGFSTNGCSSRTSSQRRANPLSGFLQFKGLYTYIHI